VKSDYENSVRPIDLGLTIPVPGGFTNGFDLMELRRVDRILARSVDLAIGDGGVGRSGFCVSDPIFPIEIA
jgi:hypothetical protein